MLWEWLAILEPKDWIDVVLTGAILTATGFSAFAALKIARIEHRRDRQEQEDDTPRVVFVGAGPVGSTGEGWWYNITLANPSRRLAIVDDFLWSQFDGEMATLGTSDSGGMYVRADTADQTGIVVAGNSLLSADRLAIPPNGQVTFYARGEPDQKIATIRSTFYFTGPGLEPHRALHYTTTHAGTANRPNKEPVVPDPLADEKALHAAYRLGVRGRDMIRRLFRDMPTEEEVEQYAQEVGLPLDPGPRAASVLRDDLVTKHFARTGQDFMADS